MEKLSQNIPAMLPQLFGEDHFSPTGRRLHPCIKLNPVTETQHQQPSGEKKNSYKMTRNKDSNPGCIITFAGHLKYDDISSPETDHVSHQFLKSKQFCLPIRLWILTTRLCQI